MEDPAIEMVQAALDDDAFQAACSEHRWRIVEFAYPRLDFVIAAIKPDGTEAEYGFRADVENYPAVAPMVKLWNLDEDRKPVGDERPQGGTRVAEAFKEWGEGTVYRPWDRKTGPHGDHANVCPHLAWTSSRDLTFIFEDLYGILANNGRKIAVRSAA